MADSKTPLESNCFYHIYNHAVGKENLFIAERNYTFFLLKIEKYLIDFMDVYSYCLIPNHFHLLVKIKDYESILKEYARLNPNKTLNPSSSISAIISQRFSHLFNSYAQAYNKMNNRKGSLFNNRFKRKHVEGDEYLVKLIHYIHFNPVHHSTVERLEDWPYSSYSSILSSNKSSLKRNEVIDLFGSVDNFIYCHSVEPNISGIDL